MKKIIVIALAVVMMVSAVAVLAACGGETVTGECKYENNWSPGKYYGAKVDVTVKNGVITKVKLYADSETGWTRTSEGWTENKNPGDLGHEKAEAAYEEWINNVFVGKTVDEVLAYKATANATEQFTGETKEGARPSYNLTGATQSAARIIVAVQNALSKIGK